MEGLGSALVVPEFVDADGRDDADVDVVAAAAATVGSCNCCDSEFASQQNCTPRHSSKTTMINNMNSIRYMFCKYKLTIKEWDQYVVYDFLVVYVQCVTT
jgi:hypothetical protein